MTRWPLLLLLALSACRFLDYGVAVDPEDPPPPDEEPPCLRGSSECSWEEIDLPDGLVDPNAFDGIRALFPVGGGAFALVGIAEAQVIRPGAEPGERCALAVRSYGVDASLLGAGAVGGYVGEQGEVCLLIDLNDGGDCELDCQDPLNTGERPPVADIARVGDELYAVIVDPNNDAEVHVFRRTAVPDGALEALLDAPADMQDRVIRAAISGLDGEVYVSITRDSTDEAELFIIDTVSNALRPVAHAAGLHELHVDEIGAYGFNVLSQPLDFRIGIAPDNLDRVDDLITSELEIFDIVTGDADLVLRGPDGFLALVTRDTGVARTLPPDRTSPMDRFIPGEGDEVWALGLHEVQRWPAAPEGTPDEVRTPDSLRDLAPLGPGRAVGLTDQALVVVEPQAASPLTTSPLPEARRGVALAVVDAPADGLPVVAVASHRDAVLQLRLFELIAGGAAGAISAPVDAGDTTVGAFAREEPGAFTFYGVDAGAAPWSILACAVDSGGVEPCRQIDTLAPLADERPWKIRLVEDGRLVLVTNLRAVDLDVFGNRPPAITDLSARGPDHGFGEFGTGGEPRVVRGCLVIPTPREVLQRKGALALREGVARPLVALDRRGVVDLFERPDGNLVALEERGLRLRLEIAPGDLPCLGTDAMTVVPEGSDRSSFNIETAMITEGEIFVSDNTNRLYRVPR